MDLDRFREVLETLRRHALRTTLTAIGVFWGVLLLVVMVGFGNGLESGTRESMSGIATNSLFIWGQRTSVPFQGQTPGRFVKLKIEDAETLSRMPGVDVVAPRISLGGRRASNSVTRGAKSDSFEVLGDTPEFLRVQPMGIRGRFLNELDMQQRRKVAVIGERVVEVLFSDDEEPIGETIRVKGVELTVVGVFKTRQTGERGAQHAATVYLPLTTFQKALAASSTDIHYLTVLVKDGVLAGTIQAALVDVIKKRHRVAPEDKEAIGSFNADAEIRKVMNLFRGISLLIYLVAGATLMAGLVGVSNIMMVSVRERTREIGIRKAIGATPRMVIGQIVLEAVALASAAGYFGLVAGVGLLEIVGAAMEGSGGSGPRMFAPPEISLATALVASIAVALGGGFAGLFPALHAARIRTVEALRDE